MYTTSDQEPKPGEYPLQAREVWHEGFAESCTPGREQLAGLFFRSCSNHFNRNPRYSYGCDRCACSRCEGDPGSGGDRRTPTDVHHLDGRLLLPEFVNDFETPA